MHLLSASQCSECLSGSFLSRYYQTIKLSLPSLHCISFVLLSALSASVVPFNPDTIGTQTLSAFAAMHLLSASQCPQCLSGSFLSRYYRNSNSQTLSAFAAMHLLSASMCPQCLSGFSSTSYLISVTVPHSLFGISSVSPTFSLCHIVPSLNTACTFHTYTSCWQGTCL